MSDRLDAVGADVLYAVIGAVAQGPDLDRVLPAVVDLLVDATACHACFIYLREEDELVVRAASPVFAHAVGTVRMRLDEGLTGWVARHGEPAFIREAALEDPRMKYFAELQEERFQSMVAVPLTLRGGEPTGVVVLHTQAPREFDQAALDFLVHVASLVTGAIDNARLYEQTRRQVASLTSITEFSEELASLSGSEALHEAGCRGIRRLTASDVCVLAIDRGDRGRVIVASDGDDGGSALAMVHAPADGRLAIPLLDGEHVFGVVATSREKAFEADEVRVSTSCAHQLALALRKAELIERLASGNLVRELFVALHQGDRVAAAVHARMAGHDPARRHVVVTAIPTAVDEARWEVELGARVDSYLRGWVPRAISDIGRHRLQALVPVVHSSGEGSAAWLIERLTETGRELGVAIGVSRARSDLSGSATGVREARDAARVVRALAPAGGAQAYEDLGPYRYLAELTERELPASPHTEAIASLEDYDARRRADLVTTLEQYLRHRSVSASAKALVVHPNTLRQRLQRIEELTGLDLASEDLLSLELALKVHGLQTPSRPVSGPSGGSPRSARRQGG